MSFTVRRTPPWSTITPVFADNSEVTNQNITNKVLAPSHLPIFASSPGPIGDQQPNTGTFTMLTANQYNGQTGGPDNRSIGYFLGVDIQEISGDVIASDNDILNPVSSSKVLTPANLTTIFANPQTIGSSTPNSAIFIDITANTINGSVVADDTIVKEGNSTTTVITPNSLNNYLASPNPIGGSQPNSATFTDLTCSAIGGDILASVEDLQLGLTTNKVITPNVLKQYLLTPGPGYFTDLYVDGLYNCEANLQEAQDGVLETKFISPKTLSDYFDQPKAIGGITPSDGAFLNITSNLLTTADLISGTISGDVIATVDDVANGNLNNKVITPSLLNKMFLSPLPFGVDNPTTAKFTDIDAQAISGDIIATLEDITNGSVDKVITPAILSAFIASPPIIGQGNPANAYFDTLYANVTYTTLGSSLTPSDAFIDTATIKSLSGDSRATDIDVQLALVDDKFVSPITLNNRLRAPPVIGGDEPNDAVFKVLACDSLTGDILATVSDIYAGTTIANKVINPVVLSEYLSDIKQDITGQSAKFAIVETTGIFIGQLGDLQNSSDAYIDTLTVSGIDGTVLATQTDLINGTEDKKVISPLTLKQFLVDPSYQIGSGSVGSACSFETVTGSQLYGVLGTVDSRLNVTGETADFNRYQGTGIANPVDIMTSTSYGYQLISLDDLNTYFAYPGDLGGEKPAAGTFTTITANTIYGQFGDTTTSSNAYFNNIDASTVSGNILAVFDDFALTNVQIPDNKVVSPSVLLEYLDSPNPIGGKNASVGNFTGLYATTGIFGQLGDVNEQSDAFINNLTVGSITGDVLATINELQSSAGSYSKVVSSYVFKEYLSQPGGNAMSRWSCRRRERA
jgi:hypothetical protein